MTTLHDLLVQALPWLHRYGYAAIAVAVFIEGIGIPAPGQTLLVGGALLAGRGQMSLSLVLLTAISATVLGDNTGYALGRQGGRRLILRLGVNRHHLVRLSRFYRRFGAWPVLLSRFFDGARQLGSMLAGTGAMPWPRFFAFDTCGALLWVGTWGFGTYQVAANVDRLQDVWEHVNPVAVVLVVCALVAIGFWLWKSDREPPSG
jgi:membrane protein DedA with SNARE-associated domain